MYNLSHLMHSAASCKKNSPQRRKERGALKKCKVKDN